MSLPVSWVPDLTSVGPRGSARVEGEEARHAVVVRRTRVGERVALVDGRGTRAEGEVVEASKAAMIVRVETCESIPAEPLRITVVQALAKGDRGESAVEMLTEVGVDLIVPWAASRCVAVWRGERAEKGLARWRATAREAAKQSRRSWWPEVAPLASTGEVADLVGAADLAVVLHEEATDRLSALDVPVAGRVLVVVGPEGGLAPDEVEAFRVAGAHAVRLGSSVLRTSTAGVAGVSALLARARW